ncbi:MAG: hypothetical protein PHS62_01275 [Patescibacteria group bacterium]|nr:hypothetical protein [Patescibacteria group bacterium]
MKNITLTALLIVLFFIPVCFALSCNIVVLLIWSLLMILKEVLHFLLLPGTLNSQNFRLLRELHRYREPIIHIIHHDCHADWDLSRHNRGCTDRTCPILRMEAFNRTLAACRSAGVKRWRIWLATA